MLTRLNCLPIGGDAYFPVASRLELGSECGYETKVEMVSWKEDKG